MPDKEDMGQTNNHNEGTPEERVFSRKVNTQVLTQLSKLRYFLYSRQNKQTINQLLKFVGQKSYGAFAKKAVGLSSVVTIVPYIRKDKPAGFFPREDAAVQCELQSDEVGATVIKVAMSA